MKKQTYTSLVVVFLLIITTLSVSALEVPQLSGYVNDYARILSSSTKGKIESYLSAVEKSHGAQIALLSIPSLEGESLEAYSLRVVDKWKLGTEKEDNGVLLLIATSEKKIRIEVGYGLEGVITDAMSGYIIRNAIVPSFKRGNFEEGISRGLQAIGGLVAGEVSISQSQIKKSQSEEKRGGSTPIFFIIFIIIFLLTRIGGYQRYRRRGISPGTALFMGMLLGSGNRHRSGGGFSGGFGGGFSGGGGGFGGGGASGGW